MGCVGCIEQKRNAPRHRSRWISLRSIHPTGQSAAIAACPLPGLRPYFPRFAGAEGAGAVGLSLLRCHCQSSKLDFEMHGSNMRSMGKTDADYLPFRIRFSIGAAATAATAACAIAAIAFDINAFVVAIQDWLQSGVSDHSFLSLSLLIGGLLVNLLLIPPTAIVFGFLGVFVCLTPCLMIAHLRPNQRNFVVAGIVAALVHVGVGINSPWIVSQGVELPSFVILFSGLIAYIFVETGRFPWIVPAGAIIAGPLPASSTGKLSSSLRVSIYSAAIAGVLGAGADGAFQRAIKPASFFSAASTDFSFTWP